MKKFEVHIILHEHRIITVEASTKEEARSEARERCLNDDFLKGHCGYEICGVELMEN